MATLCSPSPAIATASRSGATTPRRGSIATHAPFCRESKEFEPEGKAGALKAGPADERRGPGRSGFGEKRVEELCPEGEFAEHLLQPDAEFGLVRDRLFA